MVTDTKRIDALRHPVVIPNILEHIEVRLKYSAQHCSAKTFVSLSPSMASGSSKRAFTHQTKDLLRTALKSFLLTSWNLNIRLASSLFQPTHWIILVRNPYGFRPEMPSPLMNFLNRSSRKRLFVPGVSWPDNHTVPQC